MTTNNQPKGKQSKVARITEMQRFARMISESSVPDSDWTKVVLERKKREQKAGKKRKTKHVSKGGCND